MRNYWSLADCQAKALQFANRAAWQGGHHNTYQKAARSGWLEQCCSHMHACHRTLSKETCTKSAKQFTTYTEWAAADGYAYNTARDNGWLDECRAHMRPIGEYSLEECLAASQKYQTRTEWKASPDRHLMEYSHKRGWYKQCCAHMIFRGVDYAAKRSIYVYVFEDGMAYVGVTKSPESRHKRHLSSGAVKKKPGVAYQYKILESELAPMAAREAEIRWHAEFAKLYQMLNVDPPGNLGGSTPRLGKLIR